MSTLVGDEPDLQLGDSGEHVTQLQDRLRGLQLLDKQPDGSYDDATQTAVRQLQGDLGLHADGNMTLETWEALDRHMLDRGLQYNHYAGAGNQHWDRPDEGIGQDDAAAEPEPYWDGQQWLQYDPQAGQWLPMQDAASAAQGTDHADAASGAPAAEQAPVVPHIDNVHPGIRDDERFSSFHDFLRETHGS
jgi:peptidoglycan hydrolase-like protein with peptidoglycan-binding domain